MSLEVRKHDGKVVIFPVFAHQVGLDKPGVAHGEFHFPFAVHDVNLGDSGKAVFCGGLNMVGDVAAAPFIGRVALHDGTVHCFDKLLDDIDAQVVGISGLAGRELDGDTPFGFAPHRAIYFHKVVCRDARAEPDLGGCFVFHKISNLER